MKVNQDLQSQKRGVQRDQCLRYNSSIKLQPQQFNTDQVDI